MSEGIRASKGEWTSGSSAHRKGAQRGVKLPFPFRYLRSLLISLTSEGLLGFPVRIGDRSLPRCTYSPCSPPAAAEATAKAAAADRVRSRPSSGQQRLDVRASTKPRPRAAAGRRPHDDLIAAGQWGAALAAAAVRSCGGVGETLLADAILFSRLRLLSRRFRGLGWWCRCSRPRIPDPIRIPSL